MQFNVVESMNSISEEAYWSNKCEINFVIFWQKMASYWLHASLCKKYSYTPSEWEFKPY